MAQLNAMQINVAQLNLDQRSTTGQAYGYRTDYGFVAWLCLAINE